MAAVQPVKDAAAKAKAKTKRSPKQYVNTLEYELITNLVLQQYGKEGKINFETLFSLPQEDRIPGLMNEYGLKRMHQLLVMIVKAFCFSLPISKTKKLSETKIGVVACDLIVYAHEENLSLEDVILFCEQAKAGKYGPIKSLVYHYQFMSLFEQYRKERADAFYTIQMEKENSLNALGPKERICEDPTQIGEVMRRQASVIEMNKRMSG